MKFRAARHTSNLKPIIHFYHEILGLDILGNFEKHETYEGVFFGIKGESWHLEFTVSDDDADHHPDEDDLWVFYMNGETEYQVLIQKIKAAGIPSISAKNPYWNRNGTTFLDPDGFGVVISKY
ncbi:MAG: putative glyoxalase superfamily protein PhnB [Maribacter sp.]|jgi:uncharacterized glyoxalase superfamily protein PhnB